MAELGQAQALPFAAGRVGKGSVWLVRRMTGDRLFWSIAPFAGWLFEPVDVDPALRWKGSASMETTMTAEEPIPSRQRDPWDKGNWRTASVILRCSIW